MARKPEIRRKRMNEQRTKCEIKEMRKKTDRPVKNVVITTKGLQDRNIQILDGTTV